MAIQKRIEGSMKSRVTVFFIFVIAVYCVVLINGCSGGAQGVPEIVGRVESPSEKIKFTPTVVPSYKKVGDSLGNIPASWYPPKSIEKRWKAIVLHHSYTDQGNMKAFDNYHKNGHKWKGVGYDFVIGNGKGSANGRVEVTFRWRKQIAGAHCGGTPNNWANEDAVGICLVGDFTAYPPSNTQMRSLVKLIKFLQGRYKIPTSRIYGHGDTPGYKGGTKCPGKYFPMAKLKRML